MDNYSQTAIFLRPNLVRLLSALLLVTTLATGCVTTTDSTIARQADAAKAEAAYVQLGLAYIQKDNLERARDSLNRALDLNSRSAPAMAAMGLVYLKEGEKELAEDEFKRALRADSGFTRGRTYYSAMLYDQGRYEEAYKMLLRASEDTAFPDRAQVFVNLAICAQRIGKNAEAADAYQRALTLQRDNPQALLGLSGLKLEQGELVQAKQLYDRLFKQVRRSNQLQHTPQSLLLGIRLARTSGDRDQEASLALLLRNLYPESQEFRQYKAMSAQ